MDEIFEADFSFFSTGAVDCRYVGCGDVLRSEKFLRFV